MFVVACVYGWSVYKPWSTSNFFSNYTMQLSIPWLFLIWKFIHKTTWLKPHEVDLVWEKPGIDAYEETVVTAPVGFWKEMGQLFGIGRSKGGNDRRRGSINGPVVTA